MPKINLWDVLGEGTATARSNHNTHLDRNPNDTQSGLRIIWLLTKPLYHSLLHIDMQCEFKDFH